MDVRNLLLTRPLKEKGDHIRQSSCESPLKPSKMRETTASWDFCMIPRYSVLVEPHRTSQEDGLGRMGSCTVRRQTFKFLGNLSATVLFVFTGTTIPTFS